MQSFQILSRRERYASLFAAGVTSMGVISAVVLSFADDGKTPWFDGSSELARFAQRCDAAPNSSRRHECLREVAQAAARLEQTANALARQDQADMPK